MLYKIGSKIKALTLLLLFSGSLFAQLQVDIISNSVTCNGLCNGSATATVTGGSASSFTFSWSNGQTNATAINLCAGTYTVTVTASSGATAVKQTTVTQPAQLITNVIASDQICGLNPAGTATANTVGGTPPYSYSWSTGSNIAQLANLVAGTYFVTVTDQKGCTAGGSGVVIFSNEGIWLMDSTADVRCNGQANGYLSVGPMSGSAPYTYAWSNGATTKVNAPVGPGTYTVTVTEAGGCIAERTFIIKEPTPVSVSVSAGSVACGTTTTANAIASGGSGTYTYQWSNGASGAFVSGIGAGSYVVSVSDSNGCQAISNVTVQSTGSAVSATAQVVTQPTCTSNGTVAVSVFGATGSVSYAWSNGGNTPSISVSAGTYSVTVTSSGCTTTSSVTVSSPVAPIVTTAITSPATCASSGSIAANVQGATGISYLWSNGQTGATLSNLAPGTYTVTVHDAQGCSATSTIVLPLQGTGLTASINVNSQAVCNGGSATATVVGGGSLSYIWSNGQTTPTVTNLAAGNYTVTISNNQGCTTSASVSITQGSFTLTSSASATSLPTCIQGGNITASASAGQAPYSYMWSNGQTTATIANQPSGTYTVTVTDAQGCTSVSSATLSSPASPSVSIVTSSNVTCASGGGLVASASAGQAPYSYMWSNGQTTATIANQPSGTYTVTVTDAQGCTSVSVGTLSAPSQPAVTISASSNATCNSSGSATATVIAGVSPFTYAWSNGQTSATATNLAPGVYSVTITDANSCTKVTSVTIGFTNNGVNIGDYVWVDESQNGAQENAESPAPNIHVMLMASGADGVFGTADDVTVKRDTTDANGKYLFECVLPGTYILMFSNLPSGMQWTAKDNVNNDCKDSDVDANGKTAPFTVTAGGNDNLCLDAGFHVFCSNVVSAGIIGSNQTICEGQTPVTLNTVSPATGGSGPFEYLWMTLDQSGPTPTWVGIPTATSETYNPGPLFRTSYFMRCVRRAGCVTFLETNIVTITVKPLGSPGCPTFLNKFTVSPAGGQALLVEWNVLAEAPGVFYTLEHSTNMLNWSDIYMTQGTTGGTVASVNYSYTHKSPANGANHYRIVRTTIDGDRIASVERTYQMQMDALSVFPNPSVGSAKSFMRNNHFNTDALTVRIYDALGRQISVTEMPVGQSWLFEIPTDRMAEGFYYIQVLKSGAHIQTLEFVRL